MKLRISTIGIGALLLLGGCGGTSSIESGFPSPSKNTALPTGPGIDGGALLRTFKAGDTWEYGVSGSMLKEVYDYAGKTITKVQGAVTGRMVRQFTAAVLNGNNVFKVTDSLSYAINGGLTTVEVTESYATQQIDGSLLMVGRRDQSTDCAGPNGIGWIPGIWSAGASVGGKDIQVNTAGYLGATFDISTALNSTLSESVESTTTPFTAWRTAYADTSVKQWDVAARYNAGEVVSAGFLFKSVDAVQSLDWWSPLLGAPVRREYKSSRLDSVVDDVTKDGTSGVITVKYHSENRALDLVMVLKSRSLN